MSNQLVVLVDEQDNAIGVENKLRAHELGLLHRAFSVCIVRKITNQYEILLQQRSKSKYHCGGLWTNTCCSHPRLDENVIDAAQRRLYEEMGLNISLQLIDNFIYKAALSNGLIEHEYDHVLIGYYNDEKIQPNADEVKDFAWRNIDELIQDLDKNAFAYTPWLKQTLLTIKELTL